LSGRCGRSRRRCRATLGDTNAWKVGKSHQHQRDVSIPTDEATDLIVVQSAVFSVFKILVG
jgi:hypothetical protein